MHLTNLSTIASAPGGHDASFDQSLVLMLIASLILGVLVFAFVIICAVVASALSFGLWLTCAASGSETRSLVRRLRLVLGRVVLGIRTGEVTEFLGTTPDRRPRSRGQQAGGS
jgi:hypothetical protein